MFFSSKKAHKGFTLIELLIVVAIIAILAAIAVPNFLEAQTRSKVSRMRSDMRSMATGIEAYMVDYNGYPVSSYRNNWTGGPDDPDGALVNITTPISFMSKLPMDVFSNSTGDHGWNTSAGAATGPCPPQFFSGTTQMGTKSMATMLAKPRQYWVLVSYGPDASMNTVATSGTEIYSDDSAAGMEFSIDLNGDGDFDDTGEFEDVAANQFAAGNPWQISQVYLLGEPYDEDDDGDADAYWEGTPYDPTNGTLSDGDLYHWASGKIAEGFLY